MSPPKTAFSRDDVIAAALALVEEQDLDALTARAVAARLGSSVAPVYKQFGTMGELADELMASAVEQLLEYARRPWTDDRFLNMGTGIAVFARDHASLYRALFLDSDRFRNVIDAFYAGKREQMADDPRFAEMPDELRDRLLETMWRVTHGLASLMAVGLVDDTDLESIVEFLLGVGGAVIFKSWVEAGVPSEEFLARSREQGKPPCILMEE
jgi:AcrR family transcriptional regulator